MVFWSRHNAATATPVAPKTAARARAKAGSRTRILVIDSDPLVRRVLEVAIGTLGDYEVATASDGQQGMAMIEAYRPHCVLVDLLVPGVDGFTILARLGHRSRRPDRLIVSSGVMDSGMFPHLLRLGADAVLPRPFRLADLASALGLREKQPSLQFVAYLN
ncbi:MAG: response regulator [Chloroflexi bacterium]|nr:response regulator [Chloroflexota bacterium]